MKVWEIGEAFGLENLREVQREVPTPGHGEVLLKMKAASLNFRDLLMVKGMYNPRQPLPLVPCSDGVGVVESCGEGVSSLKAGDRVIPCFAPDWSSGEPTKDKLRTTLGGPLDGTLSEYMVVPEQSVVMAPEYLSDEECATLPCAGLTAWSALVTHYGLKAGDVVLAQGTGGVSLFALQIAKAHGAEVIMTSSSDEKLERVKEMGASHGINYRDVEQWGKAVRKLKPFGVDHVIEVGGADTLEQSLRAVKFGGHISMIGVLSGTLSKVNLIPILMQNLRIQGIIVGHKEAFESMNKAFATHQIRPVISDSFGWSELPDAFALMEKGGHFGKIVISF